MREEQDDPKIEGFNTKVTYRDFKTGRIIKQDPYIKRVCSKEGGGSNRYFERPAGSGNLFDKQGTPVGRWDATKPEGQRFIKDAAHIAWERPETEDEKLASRLIAQEAKNKALEAELQAIKAEKAKVQPEVKKQTKES